MKQMTCPAMGGPATCTAVLTGNTAEEMAANGTTHVMQAHPEMAESMKAMSQEDKDKWMADFKPKFNAAPEMAA
jgi:hypothetical protein